MLTTNLDLKIGNALARLPVAKLMRWGTGDAEFVRKPSDKATAEEYLAKGGYYWNSGIFVLSARTYLEEIARLEPKILEAARGALARATDDLGFLRLE